MKNIPTFESFINESIINESTKGFKSFLLSHPSWKKESKKFIDEISKYQYTTIAVNCILIEGRDPVDLRGSYNSTWPSLNMKSGEYKACTSSIGLGEDFNNAYGKIIKQYYKNIDRRELEVASWDRDIDYWDYETILSMFGTEVKLEIEVNGTRTPMSDTDRIAVYLD